MKTKEKKLQKNVKVASDTIELIAAKREKNKTDKEKDREKPGEEDDDLKERMEWFYSTRVSKDNKYKKNSSSIALASHQLRKLTRENNRKWLKEFYENPPAAPGAAGTNNWTPLGPSVIDHGQASNNPPVSGRINSIVVGPSGTRVYAGSANGGIWFSGDGGNTWQPLDDYFNSPTFISGLEEDSLSVGAIAVSFGASAAMDNVYVGTGEPIGGYIGYFGVGIKHSLNGGAPGSWTLEATNLANRKIYKIVIDPEDSTRVFVATSIGLFQRPLAAPFTNWNQVISPVFANANGTVTDFIIAGIGASKRHYAAFQFDSTYRSNDATTWTALTGVNSFARKVLAAGESDASVVYCLTQSNQLFRLVADNFEVVSGMPNIFNGGQGGYDLILAVDPVNANIVYFAGDWVIDTNYTLSLFKGTITGSSGSFAFPFNPANAASNLEPNDPTFVGQGVHADSHAIAFGMNALGTGHDGTNVWVGSDGGIFNSTMSGANGTFVNKNIGIAITEMTYIAHRPDMDSVVFGGSQDNGTVRFWGEPAWFESPQGDGGGVAVDPNNPYQMMRQYVRTSLSKSIDGGISLTGINFPPVTAATTAQTNARNTENSNTNFYGPIAVSPIGIAPTMVAFGTNRLWLSLDWGATWNTLPTNTNPYTPAIPDATQDVIGMISTIKIASATRIYAAPFSNAVFRYDLTGGVWTKTAITTVGLPSGLITAIDIDDSAAGTFYISLAGFGTFERCWYFDGAAWHNAGPATATLNIPCHAIAVDPVVPHNVYLGSDVGVWKGVRGAGFTWTWTPYSDGLPEAAILDLKIHEKARLLRASTHGRGVWEILLDETIGSPVDIYFRANYADNGRIKTGARFPWIEGAQDPTRIGHTLYHYMSPDIKVRRPSLSGLPGLGSPVTYLDFGFNIGDYIDSVEKIETADESGTNRVFVEVHNRGLTAVPGTNVRVLLLMADASAGLPALPAGYTSHINTGDTSIAWLGSNWRFADSITPYKILSGSLDVRTPLLAEFSVDFTPLSLPATHHHVCLAAFVTTLDTTDQFTGSATNLDQLAMLDKHIAQRNLHLVTLGSRPAAGEGGDANMPQTFYLDFHNADRKDSAFDLVFDNKHFDGQVSVMLPKMKFEEGKKQVKGFEVLKENNLDKNYRKHIGMWLGKLGELFEEFGEKIEQKGAMLTGEILFDDIKEMRFKKLKSIDTSIHYVSGNAKENRIDNVIIPAGECLTAVVTIQANKNIKPGTDQRLDVLQKRGNKLLGGSTYIIVVPGKKK